MQKEHNLTLPTGKSKILTMSSKLLKRKRTDLKKSIVSVSYP